MVTYLKICFNFLTLFGGLQHDRSKFSLYLQVELKQKSEKFNICNTFAGSKIWSWLNEVFFCFTEKRKIIFFSFKLKCSFSQVSMRLSVSIQYLYLFCSISISPSQTHLPRNLTHYLPPLPSLSRMLHTQNKHHTRFFSLSFSSVHSFLPSPIFQSICYLYLLCCTRYLVNSCECVNVLLMPERLLWSKCWFQMLHGTVSCLRSVPFLLLNRLQQKPFPLSLQLLLTTRN